MPFCWGVVTINDYSQRNEGLCPFPVASEERCLHGGHRGYAGVVHSGHSGNRIVYTCYRHVLSPCSWILMEMTI